MVGELAIVLLVLALVMALALLFYRRRSLASFQRKRVVLHTHEGESIGGILVGTYVDCFVLREPRHLATNASLKGEAVVLKARVDWIQVLESGDEGTT